MTSEQEGYAAEIRRPAAMRWLVLIALISLAFICGVVAVVAIERSPVTMVLMGVGALGTLVVARALMANRATRVIFDGERLLDDTGVEICLLEDIAKVERGFALFKPSSGFVLALHAPRARGWAPGLWWRVGRRVGIGGATPSRAGRNMADAITAALAGKNAA